MVHILIYIICLIFQNPCNDRKIKLSKLLFFFAKYRYMLTLPNMDSKDMYRPFAKKWRAKIDIILLLLNKFS